MNKLLTLIESPPVSAICAVAFGALGLYQRTNLVASRTLLVISWVLVWIAAYRAIHAQFVPRVLLTLLCVSIVGLALYWIDISLGPERNFCYFSLYRIDNQPVIANGQYQLGLNASGFVEQVNYWISIWGAKPTSNRHDPYYAFDFHKPPIDVVRAGGRAWDRVLPLGDYRIDFSAKNGTWYERLQIYIENGEVRERIKVTTALDGGDVLLDSDVDD